MKKKIKQEHYETILHAGRVCDEFFETARRMQHDDRVNVNILELRTMLLNAKFCLDVVRCHCLEVEANGK